jgi:dephospho-CoA kinase
LTVPGSAALKAIRAAFGKSVMQADGTLDRAGLRRLVFVDAAARRQLEAILHPRIRQEVEQALATLAAPYAIIVIPLLVETGGYHDLLSRVLVVDCPEELQIARVIARNGLTYGDVHAILEAQAGRAERLSAADDVIINAATPETLAAEVSLLHQRYLALAAEPLP